MLFYIILILLIVFTGISFYNYLTAPRLFTGGDLPESVPYLSVLIPARNEENNIGICINNLLLQSYSNIEILILDDGSTDMTKEIVKSYSNKYNNVRLIEGKPLRAGWTGKNWACYQLSQYARGEHLLFVDADIRLKEEALQSALSLFYKFDTDMFTVFPKLISKSIGESLIIPLVNWFLLSFLPLKRVHTSQNSSIVAASGQFILIKKNVYLSIGGHKQIAPEIVEDMELARNCKKRGFKVLAALGNDMVTCRMYSSFSSAFNGFSKNFFPGFNTPPVVFFIFLLAAELIFFLPVILMFYHPPFAICTGLIVSGRIFTAATNNNDIINNLLLYPAHMIMLLLLGINSVYIKHTNRIVWKGRKY